MWYNKGIDTSKLIQELEGSNHIDGSFTWTPDWHLEKPDVVTKSPLLLWQKCPVCEGKGLVDLIGGSLSCSNTCRVCNGSGIVPTPTKEDYALWWLRLDSLAKD